MVLVGANEGLVIGSLDGNKVGSVGAGVAGVTEGGFNGAPVARTSETAIDIAVVQHITIPRKTELHLTNCEIV